VPHTYADLRALPILDVLLALGWNALAFEVRNQGTEFLGMCPIHGGDDMGFSFSLEGRYLCASCKAKGQGPIDLTIGCQEVQVGRGCHLFGRRPRRSRITNSNAKTSKRPTTNFSTRPAISKLAEPANRLHAKSACRPTSWAVSADTPVRGDAWTPQSKC
jgi:hypothetical protein